MKNGKGQNFVRRNVVFSCKEDNLDYTQFEFSLPWGTAHINTSCFHETQFLGSKWISRVSPHDEEVFFPRDFIIMFSTDLFKTFRNTAHVEIGLVVMTYSRNLTISTTILSVNLVGMERERKIGIDDDYNDEQGDHFSPGSTRSSSLSWPSCGVSPLVSSFSSSEWLHAGLMRLMRLMKYNSTR